MRKFTVKVDNEAVDYMERLAFEVEGMKAIVKEIITDAQNNPVVLEGEGFKAYNAKYEERHSKYEVAKQDIQDRYIPREVIEANALSDWNLDFATGILTFRVHGLDNFKPAENIVEVK